MSAALAQFCEDIPVNPEKLLKVKHDLLYSYLIFSRSCGPYLNSKIVDLFNLSTIGCILHPRTIQKRDYKAYCKK